jgi:hypothetical protein
MECSQEQITNGLIREIWGAQYPHGDQMRGYAERPLSAMFTTCSMDLYVIITYFHVACKLLLVLEYSYTFFISGHTFRSYRKVCFISGSTLWR